ncbi:cyclophilin-like fold protein [Thermophilibacter provencensis]|uniref:cyclophilin-like fold protein n=1 Tax=Thermophilibacter provencensis TaxID=1852386 RepID=UPI0009FA0BEA|nr:cyclophilin-like fold protein [Thermophilibacter provencensis]
MMTRRNFLSVAAALGAGALLGGCSGEGNGAGSTAGAPVSAPVEEDATADGRTITVTCGEATVTYQLNDSAAADALLSQLPLTLEVEDFSDNEKVFYPPEGLDVAGAPLAESGEAGTLAYYEPWGDVVMFYGPFSPSGALYELGRAVDGAGAISGLSGAIEVALVE